jgi:hypothetical protein
MKYVAHVVVGGLVVSLTTFVQPVFAMSATDRNAQVGKQVQAKIAKLSTGVHTRLEVVLRNDTKVEGYLEDVGPLSFFVTNPDSQVSTQVAYANVKRVSASLSTGAKVGIYVGVGAVAAFLLWVAIVRPFTPY